MPAGCVPDGGLPCLYLPRMFQRWLFPTLLLLTALVLALPVLSVLASWAQWTPESGQILGEMAHTVLPRYTGTTVLLCLCVGVGVARGGHGHRHRRDAVRVSRPADAVVGTAAAAGHAGLCGGLRQYRLSAVQRTRCKAGCGPALAWKAACFPRCAAWAARSGSSPSPLYPYVYLLARTALGERGSHLMEAARLLGAPLGRRIRQVALPLARPAVAAGVALALMETLADFGVVSYFGIQTYTAGIYKAWLAMDNRLAAAQLATLLLVVVVVVLRIEHKAQRRMRFVAARGARAGSSEAQPVVLRGRHAAVAFTACALPVLLGFVLPVLFMLRPLVLAMADGSPLPWGQFVQWALNSVLLGGGSAVLALLLALLLAFAVRRQANRLTRGVVALVGLGYAIPGAVIVVGLLLPVGWLQTAFPKSGVGYWVTATVLGIVWAYMVRFCAVALQSVQSGYARIPASFDDSGPHAGHRRRSACCARVHCAAAYNARRRRGAAGVCGCDERTAGHAGAAPLQHGHAGRGGLPVGP